MTVPAWIKADILVTSLSALVGACLVARSFGASMWGVLLLSLPFVALAIAVITSTTAAAGTLALALLRRHPLRSTCRERLVFASAVGMGFLAVLVPSWWAGGSRPSLPDIAGYLLLLTVALTAATVFYPHASIPGPRSPGSAGSVRGEGHG